MTEEIKNKSKKKFVRWISAIGVIVLLVILIIYKSNNPEFKIGTTILIGSVILGGGTLIFFSFELYNRYQRILRGKEEKEVREGEIPSEVPSEELLKIVDKNILGRRNHVEQMVSITPFSIGKNSIYAFRIKTLYQDILGKEIYIILNANYATKPPAISDVSITGRQLTRLANGLSTSPEEMGETEETETYEPTTGKYHKYKKTTPRKKEEKKEKEKEEVP